ncbi:hypothetical protein AKJ08_1605 [Vulgatibacter incomptus]|uniref:Uncharacterized protein n=1 Tax=Vulgatibacter incomptus TaxID=1391653 RepID=A0A0K1PCG6_9BACT|nr:hypothetical protein AKJ08_1605 [Vulgatibacter incomptus]
MVAPLPRRAQMHAERLKKSPPRRGNDFFSSRYARERSFSFARLRLASV